jgi:hypothetical protein
MPRENSFADSEGRSLTPDLEDEFAPSFPLPRSASPQVVEQSSSEPSQDPVLQAPRRASSSTNSTSPIKHAPAPHVLSPKDRFRSSVRKVISMHRTSTIISRYGLAGAEPGVDPRRHSANIQYAHIRERCVIQIADYSTVRSSFGKMDNKRFMNMLSNEASSQREPWAKVRWINVCGISWDVMSALALKYGVLCGYNVSCEVLNDIVHRPSPSRP